VVVASIPDQVQVEREVSVVGLDPADYEIQARLREVCARLSIPVIDLLPGLRGEYESSHERLYYPKDRHLNARAHAIVAAELHAGLVALGLLGSTQLEALAP